MNKAQFSTSKAQKILLMVVALCLSLVILEVLLRLSGSVMLALQDRQNRTVPAGEAETTILCLGESTTQLGGENAYPRELERILNARSKHKIFRVINAGIGGIETIDILAKLDENIRVHQPDIIITMMGVNDREIPYREGEFKVQEARPFLTTLRTYKLFRFIAAGFPRALSDLWQQWTDHVNGPGFSSISRLGEAELKERIKQAPDDAIHYLNLARFYEQNESYGQVMDLYLAAHRIDPDNVDVLLKLAEYYRYSPDCCGHSIRLLKNAAELDPRNDAVFSYLGMLYRLEGQYRTAHDMLMHAKSLNPFNRQAEEELKLLEFQSGKMNAFYAQENVIQDELVQKSYRAVTAYNYNMLEERVRSAGIRLVAVQYPMMNVESLKRMIKNTSNTVFVDNERIFKEAVAQHGYDAYFIDHINDQFGHFTHRASRMLAENIAEHILGLK